jgi:hypothetical protein
MKPILPILSPSFVSRFWSHVDMGAQDQCWPWTGMKDRQGYGILKARPYIYRAPRVSWAITSGSELPDGMIVCHKCDCPACVNPSHLFIGTNYDNVQDKVSKGRQSHNRNGGTSGEAHPRAKLTESNVIDIRRKYQPYKTTAKMLSKEYGVSEREIKSIVYRETWSHI